MQLNRNNCWAQALVWGEIIEWNLVMREHINIDHVHKHAIYTEIGERLGDILARNQTELPASIEARLNRLRELDDDFSPSIVPALDHD
jgi:hypothetical protein